MDTLKHISMYYNPNMSQLGKKKHKLLIHFKRMYFEGMLIKLFLLKTQKLVSLSAHVCTVALKGQFVTHVLVTF